MAPSASPFDQLIQVLSGTIPPSNLSKKLKALVYEGKITVDELLRAANRAIFYQTAEVLDLVPWAAHDAVVDLRKRMLDNVQHVHDLNRRDDEGTWEMDSKAETQNAIVKAVVLRRECHDLRDRLRREDYEGKNDEGKNDEGKNDEGKNDEGKNDEGKNDEVKKEDGKNEEGKKEKIKKEES